MHARMLVSATATTIFVTTGAGLLGDDLLDRSGDVGLDGVRVA